MNDFDVISVPTFSDFVTEVGTYRPVRLFLGEKRVHPGSHPYPDKQVTLSAQGFNQYGALVWIRRSANIGWIDGRPSSPDYKAQYDGMSKLEVLVEYTLGQMGYQVRPGQHALSLPNKLQGVFDCVEWYTDEDGHTRVRPVEVSASQTQVPVSRFQVNLGDGFDLGADTPGYQREISMNLHLSCQPFA